MSSFKLEKEPGKKAEPSDVCKAMRTAKDSKYTGKGYSVMAIFSRASKLVVTSLALLLSEVLR